MRSSNTSADNLVIEADVLAIHVMRELSRAQRAGEAISLEELANRIEVRKVDVRRVVSELDRRGFVDALRLRVTMLGFALGSAVGSSELRSVRKQAAAPLLRAA